MNILDKMRMILWPIALVMVILVSSLILGVGVYEIGAAIGEVIWMTKQ